MLKEKLLLPVLLVWVVSVTSCGQNEPTANQPETATEPAVTTDYGFEKPHEYGGWYCPDNLRGFPPIDIQEFDNIKVVANRLPTLEETRNGTSLMYFDTAKIPDARPLDVGLPRVARIYSRQTGINELIIVIQAVVAGTDTVVGFRYPSGGNGSAWLREVSFLSKQDVKALGPSPMVSLSTEVHATKQKVWRALNSTEYIQKLAERFDKEAFFRSEWKSDSQVDLYLKTDSVRAIGMVSCMWGLLYLQIDYDYQGFQFTEKIMVMGSQDGTTSTIHLVAGPYPDDLQREEATWSNWLQEVKRNCR